MIVLVTGGRAFIDRASLWAKLTELHEGSRGPTTRIIEGGATGADYHAREWGKAHGLSPDTHQAKWRDIRAPGAVVKYRKGTGEPYNALAGHWRNQEMVNMKPDVVVACPGRNGTKDCVDRAKRAGLEIVYLEVV